MSRRRAIPPDGGLPELEAWIARVLASEADRHRGRPDLAAVLDDRPPLAAGPDPDGRGPREGRGPVAVHAQRLLLVAACAALVVGLTAVVLVRSGPSDRSSTSLLDPAAPQTDPVKRSAASACVASFVEAGSLVPDGEAFPRPEPDQIETLVFDSMDDPDYFGVVAIAPTGSFVCDPYFDAAGSLQGQSGTVAGPPAGEPLGRGDVLLLGTWFGQVGTDVTSVDYELDDGTVVAATVTHGWLMVPRRSPLDELDDGTIRPSAAPAQPVRINWTVRSGTSRSATIAELLR